MSKNPQLHSVAMNFLQALLDRGVDRVFANAGTDFAPIIEGLVEAQKAGIKTPEFVTVPHENVAISMAHGYFLATGKPAAVMVHVTVGTANALCGLMNASRDNAPILLMAGRTPSTEQGHIGSRNASIHWGQDSFDQGGTVREYVKWDYELRPGQPPEEIVGRALDIAMTEPRGPVYLCMPREVLGDLTESNPATPRNRELGASISAPSTKGIKQAAKYIAEAEFPVIITSCSGRDPANLAKLTRIAETYGVGVAAPGEPGARELNIPLQHPMFLGIHPGELLEKADVLLSLDCEVPWWPSAVTPRKDAKLIQVAPDPFFNNYPVRGFEMDLAIGGSTSIALCKLEDALEEACAGAAEKQKQRIEHLTTLDKNKKAALAEVTAAAAGTSPVNPVWVAECINKLKDDNTVVVNELGVPLQFLDLDQPRSYLSSSLAGGLGFGLGASLGVKMGAPDKDVILVVGDGSYMFGCPTAAHHTAKLHGVPTTTIVMNNARWHAVHRSTLGMYPDGLASKEDIMPLVSLGDTPEFDQIMAACGGHGEKVEHADQLEAALQRCLEANRNGQAALINLVASH